MDPTAHSGSDIEKALFQSLHNWVFLRKKKKVEIIKEYYQLSSNNSPSIIRL